jgi:hypothetical protein
MYDIYKLWKWYWNFDYEVDGVITKDGKALSDLTEEQAKLTTWKDLKRNSMARALWNFISAIIASIVISSLICGSVIILHITNLKVINEITEVYNVLTACIVLSSFLLIVMPLGSYVWDEIQNITGNVE